MALEPELVPFAPGDTAEVVGRMRALAASRDGWVNLHPLVDEDDLPKNSMGFFGWVSARGPQVPQATWVPGAEGRRGVEPDSIGLQHPGGPKARSLLAERGCPVPDGWVVRADHPRRGLVVELPPGTDPAVVVPWLLRAAALLTTTPLPGEWVAAVYRR